MNIKFFPYGSNDKDIKDKRCNWRDNYAKQNKIAVGSKSKFYFFLFMVNTQLLYQSFQLHP